MSKTLLGVAAALTALTAAAQEVKFEEVPAEVRETIKQQVGKNELQEIVREDRHGTIVFEVDYESSSFDHLKLLISEDGKLIEGWQATY